MCFSLLGIATFKHSHGQPGSHPVSAFNSSTSIGKNSTAFDTPHNSDGTNWFSFDLDGEDEDELLRKQSLLAKYVVAFITVFLADNYPVSVKNNLAFLQHHADAGSPLYVRLRVFRI